MAQGTLDKMVERENVLLAEVRWVLKVVQSRYSQHSYDDIVMKLTNCFKLCFLDTKLPKRSHVAELSVARL